MNYAFENPELCNRLLAELEEWKGTPFVAQMAKKQVGTDCLRFGHAVMESIGLARPVQWPVYSMKSGTEKDFDKLCAAIEDAGSVVQVPIEGPKMTGDLIVISSGRVIHHTGIYTPEQGGRIWHAAPIYGVRPAWWGDTTFTNHIKRIYRVTV